MYSDIRYKRVCSKRNVAWKNTKFYRISQTFSRNLAFYGGNEWCEIAKTKRNFAKNNVRQNFTFLENIFAKPFFKNIFAKTIGVKAIFYLFEEFSQIFCSFLNSELFREIFTFVRFFYKIFTFLFSRKFRIFRETERNEISREKKCLRKKLNFRKRLLLLQNFVKTFLRFFL